MSKLKALVRQLEFHLLLWVTGLILFVQPLSVATTRSSPDAVLWRLFVGWGLVIGLLFLVSRSYETRGQDEEAIGRPGEAGDAPPLGPPQRGGGERGTRSEGTRMGE